MINIYWNIKQNNKKSSYHARSLFLQSRVYNKREFLQILPQKSKAATGGVLEKSVFLKFRKIHRKRLVLEPLFS